MYLFGYASRTLKLQKIFGKEILLPEFTSWAFFVPKATVLSLRKQQALLSPISR